MDGLSGKPLPPQIDKTIMARMSGADRSQLKITLDFLLLTEGKNATVTEALRRLVAARGTDGWAGAVAAVVEAAYGPVVEGLDSAATRGMFEQRFRERAGVNGATLDKALRFYIAMATAGKLPLSPHLVDSPKSGNGRSTVARPRKAKEAPPAAVADETAASQRRPEGLDEVNVPIPGKTVRVWFPADLTDEEFAFMISTIKTWRRLKGPTKRRQKEDPTTE